MASLLDILPTLKNPDLVVIKCFIKRYDVQT